MRSDYHILKWQYLPRNSFAEFWKFGIEYSSSASKLNKSRRKTYTAAYSSKQFFLFLLYKIYRQVKVLN